MKREEMYVSAHDNAAVRYIYYAPPSEAWRIDRICTIYKAIYAGEPRDKDADDIEVGRLLGYSDADTMAYVEWKCVIVAKMKSVQI